MRRLLTWTRRHALGLVLIGLVAWAGWLTTSLATSTQQAAEQTGRATSAERRLDQLADDVARVCAQGGEAAAKLGGACTDADAALKQPPRQPQDGDDGRGITSTTVRDGHLMVRYTDGTITDAGQVTGPAGPNGPEGQAGRGITGTAIADGALTVTYTDGSTDTLGRVVGQSGTDGDDGRGIASVSAEDGQLVITYTDGSTESAGDLPPGPPGPQGEPGSQGDRGPQGAPPQRWTWTDPEDGTRYTCARDEDSPSDAPTYTCRADQTDTTETSSPLDPPG